MSKTRDKANTPQTNFSSTGIDDNATSTAITIDSSENVLVGKTSLDSGVTAGTEIQQNGKTFLTRDGGLPLQITRLTSDGEIATFFKDTTKVGSIGAYLGHSYITGSSYGIRFGGSNFAPVTSAGTTFADNAMDIGSSSVRFKDAYLGGNIYLGGTGSANALDDYEEGTFTPVVRSSEGGTILTSGVDYIMGNYNYTKIGNTVHCIIRIRDLRGSVGDLYVDTPFLSNRGDWNCGNTYGGRIDLTGTNSLIIRGTNQYKYGGVTYKTNA